MEFDLNDKGEIGIIALVLKPFNIICYNLQQFISVMIHNIFTDVYRFAMFTCFLSLNFHFIDLMGLKRMLEKLGLAKTHLELKKMMAEVVGGPSKDTISYHDFLNMMLGGKNAILKL